MTDRDRRVASYRRNSGDHLPRSLWGNTRRLVGFAIIGIAFVAIVYVLVTDGRLLLDYVTAVSIPLILASFVVECASLILAIPVWNQLLGHFGVISNYATDLRIYSYSMLGIVLPGGIWSAVSRMSLYERQGSAPLSVAAASVVEFILVGLAGLLVLGLTNLSQQTQALWQRPGIAFAIVGMALLLVQPPILNRLANKLMRRTEGDRLFAVKLRYADVGRWLVLESIVIFIGGTAAYLLLRSSLLVPSTIFVTTISAWAVAVTTGNLFFWVPGTLIVRDGIMVVVFAQTIPTPVAVVAVLLIRVWNLASILTLTGLIWLYWNRISRKDSSPQPVDQQD